MEPQWWHTSNLVVEEAPLVNTRHSTLLYSTEMLYFTVQYCFTLLYCTLLFWHNDLLYCICTVLYCTAVLYYTSALCSTVLHYSSLLLYCTSILYFTVPYFNTVLYRYLLYYTTREHVMAPCRTTLIIFFCASLVWRRFWIVFKSGGLEEAWVDWLPICISGVVDNCAGSLG